MIAIAAVTLILLTFVVPIGFVLNLAMIAVVAVMAAAFSVRFKLASVPGEPSVVLKDLAHRLRISGYRVDHKRDMLVIQVAPLTSINVRAKAAGDATIIKYWAGATPSGWSVIIVLILVFFPVGIPMILAVFYKSVVFATERVLPRLSQLPIGGERGDREVRALLIDSLAEGRRLSAEAYEAAQSNYEDAIILSFAITILGSFTVGVLIGMYGPGQIGGQSPITLLAFMVAGLAAFLIFFLSLRRRRKPVLDTLRTWSVTLEGALNREVSSLPPSDGEPSSFELIGESCRLIPDWLGVRRRGGRFREPGDWLVIGLLAYAGCIIIATGVLQWAFWPEGDSAHEIIAWAIGGGTALVSVAFLVYLRWRKRQSLESAQTMQDWTARCRALKTNLQEFIEDV